MNRYKNFQNVKAKYLRLSLILLKIIIYIEKTVEDILNHFGLAVSWHSFS